MLLLQGARRSAVRVPRVQTEGLAYYALQASSKVKLETRSARKGALKTAPLQKVVTLWRTVCATRGFLDPAAVSVRHATQGNTRQKRDLMFVWLVMPASTSNPQDQGHAYPVF